MLIVRIQSATLSALINDVSNAHVTYIMPTVLRLRKRVM